MLSVVSSGTKMSFRAPYDVKVSDDQFAMVPIVNIIVAGIPIVRHGSGSTINETWRK